MWITTRRLNLRVVLSLSEERCENQLSYVSISFMKLCIIFRQNIQNFLAFKAIHLYRPPAGKCIQNATPY